MGKVYTVTQVNGYLKGLFRQDPLLGRISVKGEVSNCKYHSSGHIYFTLKDRGGAIACVMFAGQRTGLAFRMKDGDQVVAEGAVNVYEKTGSYQLYAASIVREGAGDLYERFLALKAELEEMGMFAPEYKRPIPKYAKRIGIVTAPTGAAVQDIRNISLRRNPYVQLILYPALVQGEGAKESIVKGLQALDRLGLDVIIVGRGGGSIEDLWAFNEEMVARAIFACETPVISAVGHETDTTIADFAADLRAPTPSAAAELAVADVRGILEQMEHLRGSFQKGLLRKIRDARSRLRGYETRWNYLRPEHQIREMRMRLAELEERMETAQKTGLTKVRERIGRLEDRMMRGAGEKLTVNRHRLELLIRQMEGLSPLKKLNRGFSYVEEAGRCVRSTGDVQAGDLLTIHVTDGKIKSRVEEIISEGEYPLQECRALSDRQERILPGEA